VVVVDCADEDPVVVVVVVVELLLSDFDDSADSDGCADRAAASVVTGPAPFEREAGGTGSTAPSSDGSCSGRPAPSDSAPNTKSVQVIAPTTAPTASRP
jgi:hypothetical protein